MYILFALLLLCPFVSRAVDFSHGDLKVSPNHRYLVHADGTPFFYLGDTAWELFHRLKREEAEQYFENRKQKGFTVIQAVILAELDGLNFPNAAGWRPLTYGDPTIPNRGYFADVDAMVKSAEKAGLYIGMLPTWGDKVKSAPWEKKPDVRFTPKNAHTYGKILGERYKDAPNIIWILGGDRSPEDVEDIWREMAAGLKEGDGGRHLITYHPGGGASSADLLNKEPWLDFNMLQSGHKKRNLRNDLMIQKDYNLTPVKPTMDGEARYENHPINWKPENGWFDDFDVRQAAYWALFAGAHGHTYGCHDVWQMKTAEREPVSFARGDWKTSLDLPGARQMGYVRQLMESRPMLTRVPDQSLIITQPATDEDHIQATRGDNYAFVYIPTGKPVSIQMGKIQGDKVKASWFDPRTGKTQEAGRIANKGPHHFTPPGKPGRGNDWVLVLDSVPNQ
jgi:hypothetical protein